MAYYRGKVEDVVLAPDEILEEALYALKKFGLVTAPDRIVDHVAKMFKVLEYLNNVRAAQVGNQEQIEKYLLASDRGCCASYDIVLDLGDQGLWLVGGNYGH